MTFVAGSDVVIQGTFKNMANSVEDMTAVSLRVILPDDTEVTITTEITSPSTGVYRRIYRTTLSGVYEFQWTGDDVSGYISAGRTSFFVLDSL